MKFQALKSMVESIISSYKCTECSSEITDENVEIIGTAGTNINIEIVCPKCKKGAIVKGQVFDLDFSSLGLDLEKLKNLKSNNPNSIKDSEIKEFNKTLKTEISSISDLFGEKNNNKNK